MFIFLGVFVVVFLFCFVELIVVEVVECVEVIVVDNEYGVIFVVVIVCGVFFGNEFFVMESYIVGVIVVGFGME